MLHWLATLKIMTMKQSLLAIMLLTSVKMLTAQVKVPPTDIQIKLALMAAPEEKREGAMVYGYDSKGAFTVLRPGTNEMICLADDPAQKGFSVACYHKDLEPFMARGRELKAQGKESKEIMDIRDAETKAGKLKMNTVPSTLYVYTAKEEDCDLVAGTVNNGYLRYVIYIPNATSASTGLPLKPGAPGMPWIMYPGTPRAHIMINPPAAKQ
jgi:hypothetical protein